jgi:zinc protease
MDETIAADERRSLPGPDDVLMRVLPNGLTVMARENFSSAAVVAQGYLLVGSQDESEDQKGLASLTASMLLRGTTRRSFHEINEAIEDVGASLSIAAGIHTTRFGLKGLAEDFTRLLDVAAEALRHPSFPADQWERVRSQRLTGLRERENNTQAVADRAFYETLYPVGHPYRLPVEGLVETVEAMKLDDLVAFHHAHYEPQGGVIVVVGAMPAAEAIAKVAALFGDWPNRPGRSRPDIPEVHLPAEPIQTFRPVPGKTQSDVVIGTLSVARKHPDYLPIYVANTILGVFGLMGRLGEAVRDKQGLAYYARSAHDASIAPGTWRAMSGVAPDKVTQAVETIKTEFQRLGAEIVPDEELADSQSFLTGSLPLRLETNEGVARSLLDIAFFDLGLDYLQRYSEIINAITPAEVQRVAATYLKPEGMVLAVAGPP